MIIPQKTGARDPGKLKGDIVFEHVSLAYKPGVTVLKDNNLTIKQGQRIGICGPTVAANLLSPVSFQGYMILHRAVF